MDGKIIIGTDIDTKSFDAQIDYIESRMEDIEDKLKQADMGFEVGDTEKLEAEYEKLGNQLIGLREKQEKFNQSIREAQTAGFERIKDSIDSVGSKLTSVTKKVGRWALAVFGVRSAYLFVRSAINTITQDDKQLANDIQAVKTALAYTIEPLVRKIVELAKTLMNYVAYIVKAWTGRDIFASASKNLKNASKSAKELQKTSASFDKFNKLSSGSSSGGGARTTSSIKGIDGNVPEWIKWIAQNKNVILGFFTELGLIIASFKLAQLLQTLGLFSALPLWQVIIGVGLILAGIVIAIKGIVDFIKDPSWNNFLTILEGIALVVAGIAVLLGGWVVALVAVGTAIVAYLIKNWDKVKEVFSNAIQWIKDKFNALISFFSNLISKIVDLFKKIGTKVGDVIGSAFKAVINGVLKAIETILNTPIRTINKLINVINKVPGINLGNLNEFKLPRLARGGIVNQPGRGVMMGSYVAGEKGPEAVIPLNDETISRLGNAIAKKITVNADITLELESRVLARVMQEINNDTKFARNGG